MAPGACPRRQAWRSAGRRGMQSATRRDSEADGDTGLWRHCRAYVEMEWCVPTAEKLSGIATPTCTSPPRPRAHARTKRSYSCCQPGAGGCSSSNRSVSTSTTGRHLVPFAHRSARQRRQRQRGPRRGCAGALCTTVGRHRRQHAHVGTCTFRWPFSRADSRGGGAHARQAIAGTDGRNGKELVVVSTRRAVLGGCPVTSCGHHAHSQLGC